MLVNDLFCSFGSFGQNILSSEILFTGNMIFKLLHAICPPRIAFLPSRFVRRVYSEWIKYEFHSCGKHCFFGKFFVLHGGKYIDIADNVTFGVDLVIEVYDRYQEQRFAPVVKIGSCVNIGDSSHLSCINGI